MLMETKILITSISVQNNFVFLLYQLFGEVKSFVLFGGNKGSERKERREKNRNE